MESSLNPWEVTLFAGLFYGTVVVLLALLGYFHMLNKREELAEGARGLHVDAYGKDTLILRSALGSCIPYAVTFLVWTAWLVIFAIENHSIAALVALIVAICMLVGCLVVFVRMVRHMNDFTEQHSGPKRQKTAIQPEEEIG